MVKQQRAVRTRQSLVRAAAEVFAQEGFSTASLAVISRRAGVSNGALHFHFANKQALARAVTEEAAAILEDIMDSEAARSCGALQQLVDGTYRMMTALGQDAVVRAGFELSGEAEDRKAFVAEGRADLRGQWGRWVERVLADAEQEGALADGVAARDAALVVVASTFGLEVLAVMDRAWGSHATLGRFWTVLLPRLASTAAYAGLLAQGTQRAPEGGEAHLPG